MSALAPLPLSPEQGKRLYGVWGHSVWYALCVHLSVLTDDNTLGKSAPLAGSPFLNLYNEEIE